MNINWVKVSEEVLSGGITLLVSFSTLLMHNWITARRDKRREGILFELATMRGKGVELRNYGERHELVGSDLSGWIVQVRQLESAMIAKASEVSGVEGKRLQYLDRVPALAYPDIANPDQLTALQNLSGLLVRSDTILAKYRF